MAKLHNKVAVVTGASAGMGRDIAYHYAKEGAKVLAVARRIERLKALAEEAKGLEGEIAPFVADVSKKSQAEAMVDEAVKVFGRIDILVNNAGVMDDFSPVGDVQDDVWDEVMSVNLTGPFYAMRRAVGHFGRTGGGVVVNVSSVGGLCGTRAGAAYTVSKHGLIGLTKNTAFMYANQNVRCNAICPGGVDTEMTAGLHAKKIHKEGMARMRAGMGSHPRMGKGSEIAAVAVFLASEDAAYVNGQCIAVDGGWLAY